MKYIHNRDHFKKLILETMLDSDKMNVEFGDTLIGGLLNRVLGGLTSTKSKVDLSLLSKKLDKKLASMLIEKSAEQVEEIVQKFSEESEEFNPEEFSEDVTTLLLLPAIEEIIEDVENGNKENAQEKVNLLPEPNEKSVKHLAPYIEQTKELVKQEFGEEVSKDVEQSDEITKKEDDNENNQIESSVDKRLNESIEKLKKLKDYCRACIKGSDNKIKIQKLLKYAEDIIESLKTKLKNNDLEDIEQIFTQLDLTFDKIEKFCESCVNDSEKVSESLLSEIDLLLEEFEETATKEATKKINSNNLKKSISKKKESTRITKEDLKKLEDKVKNIKGFEDKITGADYKDIINILMRAKNKLIATKPYDQIRKKQQRYYDRIEGGRAINRKGYQTWNKKVSEIVSYYKELLPEKVKRLLMDSLDKTEMGNDYINIQKDFLGLKPKEKDLLSKDSDNRIDKTKKGQTRDREVGFVGIKQISINDLKLSGIAISGKLDNKKINLVGVIVPSPDAIDELCIKFSINNNVGFLSSYFTPKISKGGLSAKTDDQIDAFENSTFSSSTSDVYYAEIKVRNGLSDGQEYSIDYGNLSKSISKSYVPRKDYYIEHKRFETRSAKLSIEKLGLLVGVKDGKPARGRANEDLKTEKDAYLSKNTKLKLHRLFKGNLTDDEIRRDRFIRDVYTSVGDSIPSDELYDSIRNVLSNKKDIKNTDSFIKDVLDDYESNK